MNPPRLIAYYLPQYHPIPENDAWWGNGFTEWTNVAKAKPLFRGHYQPHIPADLGFYDLRVPEVREAQAALAREAGIEGFCYWHYWFGGKRLLERPFDEVLASGKPDFPFCLAWANASWTGIWYGADDRILQEQTYPGLEDHRAHFEALLPAFKDPRYIRVDGKPLFMIFQPVDLSADVIAFWQQLALAAGLPGITLPVLSIILRKPRRLGRMVLQPAPYPAPLGAVQASLGIASCGAACSGINAQRTPIRSSFTNPFTCMTAAAPCLLSISSRRMGWTFTPACCRAGIIPRGQA